MHSDDPFYHRGTQCLLLYDFFAGLRRCYAEAWWPPILLFYEPHPQMKRCKPHRKYIAFCNLNIYIFFITICFQIFKTTFYLKLFCMRDIFYCMIWIAFFFSQQNRLFKFAKQKFLHSKLTYLHVFIYNSKKKKKH